MANSPVKNVIEQAQQHLRANQPELAYSLLTKQEDIYQGDPLFDYWLGISALQTGKTGLAVFALERVVHTDGNNAGAKADLGRAYFKLGQYRQAKDWFGQALQLDPPPQAEKHIQEYLEKIEQLMNQKQYLWFSNINISGGYDSNANNGINNPSLISTELASSFHATESLFTRNTISSQLIRAQSKYKTEALSIFYLNSRYDNATTVNHDLLSVGYHWNQRGIQLDKRLSLSYNTQLIQSNKYANSVHIKQTFVWPKPYANISLAATFDTKKHAAQFRFRDTVDGAILMKADKIQLLSSLEQQASLSLKNASPATSNGRYGNKQLSLNWKGTSKPWRFIKASTQFQFTASRYDSLFGITADQLRTDRDISVQADLTYERKKWSVSLSYLHFNRQSSVELYKHNKNTIVTGIGFNF